MPVFVNMKQDKCYDQLGFNNDCYDEAGLNSFDDEAGLTAVTTKLVVTAVATKLVVLAYFQKSCDPHQLTEWPNIVEYL